MKLYEVSGTYGSGKTLCTVFVASNGADKWYVVEGSVNVNITLDEIEDGVDVEILSDYDMFTASEPINSLEELEQAINE